MQSCLDAYSTDPSTAPRRPELGALDSRGVGASNDEEASVVASTVTEFSAFAGFGADSSAPTIQIANSNGGKRPLNIEDIRDPDHLPRRTAEARQDFFAALAAKKAKLNDQSHVVLITITDGFVS